MTEKCRHLSRHPLHPTETISWVSPFISLTCSVWPDCQMLYRPCIPQHVESFTRVSCIQLANILWRKLLQMVTAVMKLKDVCSLKGKL